MGTSVSERQSANGYCVRNATRLILSFDLLQLDRERWANVAPFAPFRDEKTWLRRPSACSRGRSDAPSRQGGRSRLPQANIPKGDLAPWAKTSRRSRRWPASGGHCRIASRPPEPPATSPTEKSHAPSAIMTPIVIQAGVYPAWSTVAPNNAGPTAIPRLVIIML
jgi:hypothetical protein